jgi:hypothetical protein
MPSFFGNGGAWGVPTFLRRADNSTDALSYRLSHLWKDAEDGVWFVFGPDERLRLVNWLSPLDLLRFPFHWFWMWRYGK